MLAALTFQHSLSLTLLLDEINVYPTTLYELYFKNVDIQ